MRPDDQARKGPGTKGRHPHEHPKDPRGIVQAPRSWTNKTMHHPATRIGEIRHGKS
jgi:hypothetical protein